MNIFTSNFFYSFSFLIGKGENSQHCTYARFMRHKCLKFCPLFHTAVLLFARFKVTNKLQRIDFTKNDEWFKIKLIANLMSCNEFKHIKDRMGGRFYEEKNKQL